MLKVNFDELDSKEEILRRIARTINEKQAELRAKDGVSQSKGLKALSRTARFIMSTKDAVMGVSRLDPHGIAPIALGGVYTLVQLIQGGSDESQAALSITLEVAELVAFWTAVEKRQISTNRNPSLGKLYTELSTAVVNLYKAIIVLLGTLIAYFHRSRWCKCSEDDRLDHELTVI